MSALQDFRRAQAEPATRADITEAALASIRYSEAARRGEAEAILVAAAAFGDAVKDGPLARAAKAAQAFCIISAGVIPVALFWAFVYPG